jgi:putative SOS response-associated peptidase YedK
MCGRYRFDADRHDLEQIERQTGMLLSEAAPEARTMLATNTILRPYDDVPVLIGDGGGEARLVTAYWQLIHSFCKTFESPYTNFNTRYESLEKKHNRDLLERRRCLFPATSFFETRKDENGNLIKPKETYEFFAQDGSILFLGGLYTIWRNPRDREDARLSCSIITMEPNEIVGEVHPRMPLIVPDAHCRLWLDREATELEFAFGLIKPAPSAVLRRVREK